MASSPERTPVKPQGHANIEALCKAVTALSEPGEIPASEAAAVQGLSHQFERILEPFAKVEATNGRWLDAVGSAAKKVRDACKALGLEDSHLRLTQSIEALEPYGERILSVESEHKMILGSMMDPPKLMDTLTQALNHFATGVEPLDERMLMKDADDIDDLCDGLKMKLARCRNGEDEYKRASTLMAQAAVALAAAAEIPGLSSEAQEKLTRFAVKAIGRKEDLKEDMKK